MPSALDHIILGVNDLDRGIAWVQERTSVRAAFGGVHPGRGTRNALLSLGPRCYLEIMAPDPQQPSQSWYVELPTLQQPRLVGWAVSTVDIVALAKQVTAAGFAIHGPNQGSRESPSGTILRWTSFRLKDDRGGLLPFFIEWSPESVHPSVDAPTGCTLNRFFLLSPTPQEMARTCQDLDVDVTVEGDEKPGLRACITGAGNDVELIS